MLILGVLLLIMIVIGLVAVVYGRVQGGAWKTFRIAAEFLVLVILVAWGLAYNAASQGHCRVSSCDVDGPFRPLAEPAVFGLLGLHVVTVVGYWTSRRRPEALHGAAEAVVSGVLMVGLLAAHGDRDAVREVAEARIDRMYR